ncbi:hypothetical protein L1D59_23060, partial [Pseudoalteromonas piscicida]|uniref:hypothetical protein n=1 Tax=Pseudoalteromonas piscicida TaxID=43662 RepID=UPI001EFEB4D1
IELLYKNQIFDLHNLYCIESIEMVNFLNEFLITFSPIERYTSKREIVQLKFHNVSYFNLNVLKTRGQSIEEIGYKPANDFDDEWLLDHKDASPQDHMHIRIDYDSYIRIFSESVSVNIFKKGS